MLACICGGILEILMVSGFFLATLVSSVLGTNWYNKRAYKKYVEYKNKHKGCDCHCHDGEC